MLELNKEQRFDLQSDMDEFEHLLNKLAVGWRYVSRERKINPENHDADNLHTLGYVIEQATIPLEVYSRDKSINAGYVLEKLYKAKYSLSAVIAYFEHKSAMESAK